MRSIRGRQAAGALGIFGLLFLTLSTVVGSSAGASVKATARRVPVSSVHRFVAHHPQVRVTGSGPAGSGSASLAPLAVTPPSSSPPACYGDARTITPVGGPLDPASFGAFYNCASAKWTFEVQTQDTWPQSSFGDWTVLLDTDGLPDNCQGWDYFAQFSQPTAGTLRAVVGPLNSTCSLVSNQAATGGINGNTVSVTIPASTIGNASTLTWSGALQTFAEQTQGGGNFVPCDGNPACGGVSPDGQLLLGAVAESLPSPTPASCSSNVSTTEVVTLPNPSQDAQAVTALNQPGFTNVHDYGEGILSFIGNAATAGADIKAALGLSAAPPIAPAQGYTPQAIITTGPSATPVGSQWNLPVIGAAGAQSVSTGNGVVVADIDTGLDYLDPNFGANPMNGWDESTGVAMGRGPATTSLPEVGNTDTGQRNAGDGTATAGVIAAVTTGTGLTSLGLNTRVLPVKVNFDDAAASAEIAAGIRWAANNGAQIINLPFSGVCPDANLLSAIQYAESQGKLVVAAAGNGALNANLDTVNGTNDAPAYPAAYSVTAPGSTPSGQARVVAVGATGGDGIRASYSNTNNYVSMVAPGGSAIPGDTADDISVIAPGDQCPGEPCYTTGAGTAFAAAQASAQAALIWAVNPTLTPSQTRELVTSTTTDQGVSGTDLEYGTGMENASVALTDTPPPSPAAPAKPSYGTFVPLRSPCRILDTRTPQPGHPGGTPLLGGIPQSVTIPGAACIGGGTVPASGLAAVVINATVTQPTAGSFLTMWPAGQARPNASNINFSPNQTIPNLVTVKLGAGGQVSLFNSSGSVHLILDVAGYYVGANQTAGSTFVPCAPTRLLDTRSAGAGGPVRGGLVPRALTVTGAACQTASGATVTVPDDATGAVFNVTVTGASNSSYLTVAGADVPTAPTASNLNFSVNQTIPNLVSTRLGQVGAGPHKGINLFNAAGTVQVIVDLEGWFTGPGDPPGSRFFPVVAHRILDTRFNIGGVYTPIPAPPASPVPVNVVGQGGVLDGGSAAVMNTTVTAPTAGSYLTVYPALIARPNASNLNFGPGQTIANLVSAEIGSNGQDDFYNNSGTVQAIADVVGWYGPAGS